MPRTAKNSAPKGDTRTPRRTEVEFAPNAATLYSNSVQVRVSVYDFVLTFGEVTEVTEDVAKVMGLARVILSPQHAKVLSEILARRVEQYEENFGRLPSNPGETTIEEIG